MNIYFIDQNPKLAAQALDDKLLGLSLARVGPILGTAMHILGMWDTTMEKPGVDGHPTIKWVVETQNNFRWYVHYAKALCDEHKFRFGIYPLVWRGVNHVWSVYNGQKPPRPIKRNMTPFRNLTVFNGMNNNYDVVEAYRKEMCERNWDLQTGWTKREKPKWYYIKHLNKALL